MYTHGVLLVWLYLHHCASRHLEAVLIGCIIINSVYIHRVYTWCALRVLTQGVLLVVLLLLLLLLLYLHHRASRHP